MNSNKGDVIERIVRTKIGISELSRILHVSRTSIYNWFERGHLNFDTICKIGEAIDHDFANEFPEEFAKAKNPVLTKVSSENTVMRLGDESSIHYWMNKYIALLEKYNELLTDMGTPDPRTNLNSFDPIEANACNAEVISRIDNRDHSLSYYV